MKPEAIMKISNCCQETRGQELLLHSYKKLESSRYAVTYFDLTNPVASRNGTDDCILAGFANSIVLMDGIETEPAYLHIFQRLDRPQMRQVG